MVWTGTQLPDGVTYGTVTGQLVSAVLDGSDGDTNPDMTPVQGKVTFTLNSPYLLETSADLVILPQPITVTLDSNGYFSVNLIATDSPGLNGTGWTYTVAFSITGLKFPTYSIEVPGGTTQDLSTITPVPSSSGTPILRGETGPAPTLEIGTVTTLSSGSSATVSVTEVSSGTYSLGFGLVTGDTGPSGPANSLTIGTVTTGAAGSSAAADITGTAPSQTLDLTIPRGDTGATGATGPANTLVIGTVTTGAAGSSAAADITGTAPNQTLDLTIPKGDTGPANTLAIGTITTVANGSGSSATITGTSPNQTLNLTLEAGPQGPPGSGDVSSVNSITPDGTGNVTLTASNVGAVPTTTTVNGHALSANVTLTSSDVGAVPTTTTVNGHALSANVTLAVSDISGAVPNTTTVNGHALSANVTVTASDVGAVPTTTTVNGHALSSNVTITASDVSAIPLSGGTITGDVVSTTGASFAGPRKRNVVTTSTSHTTAAADDVVVITGTSAASVTFSNIAKKEVTVINTNTGPVNLVAAGGVTLYGFPTALDSGAAIVASSDSTGANIYAVSTKAVAGTDSLSFAAGNDSRIVNAVANTDYEYIEAKGYLRTFLFGGS